ncbi:MAG: HAD family hydrolase [Verrucomicrobia bacterium]|nr:HAD family hydrolase [Verrucomicrobiota bacterium]
MQSTSRFTGLVEFRQGFQKRTGLTHILFDFDGTLSLIRQGWPDIMVPLFTEILPPLPDETDEQRRQLAFEDIMRLNGKQTIYQMIQLAERVRERGGTPGEPLDYKHEYLRRLDERIRHRVEGIQAGTIPRGEFTVFGTRALLEALSTRGLSLYLASGTDEQFVKAEAEALGLTHYFKGHIYGAQDDYKKFSKKMIIDRILAENRIPGDSLLAFGDGYVEIENTKQVGGFAVAVASDEANNGSGRFDPWKHQRLMGVGADLCIPDYRELDALMETLFP